MEASTETQYIKCNGCRCIRAEDEYELYKGTRRKSCNKCKNNRAKYKCDHNKQKSQCKECGGSQICIHNKKKSRWKECGGGSICDHGREKIYCKECGGSQICIHNKIKSQCKQCGGSQICEHNRLKSICKECGGGSICEHQKRKNLCKICNLEQCLINIQRVAIRRMLQNSELLKTKHTIEYLGCDSDFFKEYLKNKMTPDMTFDNIHIDHIKPISKFNLSDPDEFLQCSHYTNLQPLLAKDNLDKSNKWTDENELFWRDNIIYKEYFKIYI
jgi:hypothetical protein